LRLSEAARRNLTSIESVAAGFLDLEETGRT
jgi:hypothetical protein